MARETRLSRRAAGFTAFAVLLLAASCGAVPAGRLRGEVQPQPDDWAVLTDGLSGICEIESRPEDPHSIQLQCYEVDGVLYVNSHRWALSSWYPFTSWAAIWIEHPDVRARFSDAICGASSSHRSYPESSSFFASRSLFFFCFATVDFNLFRSSGLLFCGSRSLSRIS